ncbi:MAG: metal-binding protein [Tissierellia bacterium]|nr:metal-binding protein [Tissierellia bacterium]
MEKSYRFYTNEACSFLPCHKTEDLENFNCLFCYCPLYMLEEKCGGNFEIKGGVKDCSNCMIPHKPNGYEYINEKLGEYIANKAIERLSEED